MQLTAAFANRKPELQPQARAVPSGPPDTLPPRIRPSHVAMAGIILDRAGAVIFRALLDPVLGLTIDKLGATPHSASIGAVDQTCGDSPGLHLLQIARNRSVRNGSEGHEKAKNRRMIRIRRAQKLPRLNVIRATRCPAGQQPQNTQHDQCSFHFSHFYLFWFCNIYHFSRGFFTSSSTANSAW